MVSVVKCRLQPPTLTLPHSRPGAESGKDQIKNPKIEEIYPGKSLYTVQATAILQKCHIPRALSFPAVSMLISNTHHNTYHASGECMRTYLHLDN